MVLGRVAPRVAQGREPLLKEPFARAACFQRPPSKPPTNKKLVSMKVQIMKMC